MSFLSDVDILARIKTGEIRIEPFDESMVQPASIDLTLSRHFKRMEESAVPHDVREEVKYRSYESEKFVLRSLSFALGSTVERITLAPNIVGRLEGKSSLGRIGLTAHVTAGFFDPGFDGHATLELFNASPRTLLLYEGMKICQMSFAMSRSEAAKPYGHPDLGSKYQNQSEKPEGSQYHKNFLNDVPLCPNGCGPMKRMAGGLYECISDHK